MPADESPDPAAPLAGSSSPFRPAALFAPRRVLLLADPALRESAVLARNLASGGFRGSLQALTPADGTQWEGLSPLRSLDDLAEAPELAVIALPPERIGPALMELGRRGCRAAVVPVAAPELAEQARAAGVRAVGQRSFGLANPALGLNATLSHLPIRPGRLALLCQSSALARAVIDYAEAQGVGFSLICGIGGNADYGFAGALDWLARDSTTGAVVLDLRRIKNRRQFISAARATARTRPVVAIRPGSAAPIASAGSVAVGPLPGSTAEAAMDAALRRAGVLRVETLGELLAAAETLARVRLSALRSGAEADRIAIVSNGLASGQLAADEAVRRGGRLAVIPEAARTMLDLALPADWHGENPLVMPPGQGHRLAEAAAMLASLPEVGTVVAIHTPSPFEDGEAAVRAMQATAGMRGAPVLVGWLGQATGSPQRAALAKAGVAVFPTPERAVRGALHLAQDRRNREFAAELPASDVLEFVPDRATVRRILDAVRAAGRLALNEAQSLDVLEAYGIPTVARRPARDANEAGKAAMELGFPVVLKVLTADLPGKTEADGVQLSLRDVKGVRTAGGAMLSRLARERPELRLDGLLVQRQAAAGAELRLRVGDDAMFGPWIGFGAGGTAADLQPDEAVDLLPLNLPLAEALIGSTRVARRLRGWRDHPAVPTEPIARALVRLSALAVDFPEIATIAANPLIATPTGAVVVDADLRLRPAGENSMLAIPPYPAELSLPWASPTGETLTVRPIRPEDAEAHARTVRAMSEDDMRWRFFGSIRNLSAVQIARMTQIDYEREMAFVAVQAVAGEADRIVGVSRIVRQGFAGDDAEFAVMVLNEWKGRGLGTHLMRRAIDWAREVGVRRIEGQILHDNVPMQNFARKLGFTLRRSEDDALDALLVLG
ncbi:bifunctional acetate--CoA ligase family protein/GNAT family N-acetyltransferase [Roseomonas elaeocarpi]|uniref:Bifunctional acetate--CoA ligase family protein/GNAT family N-acetyltransferase n=1 Tax=Roseomonas elaeocarpi TaxID=907779 RepID=A0ABV6K1Q1_9PROT